jgi:hypothetical protein
VGGNGAIVNSGGFGQINAVQALVLSSDASIGGTQRWDFRGPASATLALNEYTLTKTGSNYIALAAT